MAPRAIVNFNELPATFLVEGGRWLKRRSLKVQFDVTRESIIAEIPTNNSFEAIRVEGTGGEDLNPRPARGPIIRVIKRNGNSAKVSKPVVNEAKKENKPRRKKGRKCASQRGKTGALRKLARSPALEQANATLWRAAKDLLDSPRKILFGSIPFDMDNVV